MEYNVQIMSLRDNCKGWFGEGVSVEENGRYVILHNSLEFNMYSISIMRDEGFLFCGQLHTGASFFTWEGE